MSAPDLCRPDERATVAAQANELDLALDVYRQLVREGCTPNLVTYNILIDVYGKMGSWQEAVQVLDALESQVLAGMS